MAIAWVDAFHFGVVRTFPPSLRYGEARRSTKCGGGRSAVSGRPKGLHYIGVESAVVSPWRLFYIGIENALAPTDDPGS